MPHDPSGVITHTTSSQLQRAEGRHIKIKDALKAAAAVAPFLDGREIAIAAAPATTEGQGRAGMPEEKERFREHGSPPMMPPRPKRTRAASLRPHDSWLVRQRLPEYTRPPNTLSLSVSSYPPHQHPLRSYFSPLWLPKKKNKKLSLSRTFY